MYLLFPFVNSGDLKNGIPLNGIFNENSEVKNQLRSNGNKERLEFIIYK